MEVEFVCVVVDWCSVDLKLGLAEYKGPPGDLASQRTRSKHRCGLSLLVIPSLGCSRPLKFPVSLRLGDITVQHPSRLQIWLNQFPIDTNHHLNRISYLTGAEVAEGCNLTVTLFGDSQFSDEESTITCGSWIALMGCYWAWPTQILKACSLAIAEDDGPTSEYNHSLSGAQGITLSIVRKLKFSWFFKNLETFKHWPRFESLNPDIIILNTFASFVAISYVIGRITRVGIACLERLSPHLIHKPLEKSWESFSSFEASLLRPLPFSMRWDWLTSYKPETYSNFLNVLTSLASRSSLIESSGTPLTGGRNSSIKSLLKVTNCRFSGLTVILDAFEVFFESAVHLSR